MPEPRTGAKPPVDKVASQRGSGDENVEGHAGSGRGVDEISKPANDPRGGEGPLAPGVLYSLGDIPIPVVSELAKLGLLDDQIVPRQLSFPVYGNYCGFGHGDPTGNTPPIDAVDAVCREHDLCYGLLGDFDSRCDRNLIEIMPSAIASTPSPIGKKAGLLALLYFAVAERNLALGETLFKRT